MTRPVEVDPTAPQDPPGPSATTVLDRVRPTVVVRRRVYEVPRGPGAPVAATHGARAAPVEDELAEDENGPPSSVNVARALASLRVDELRRLEEIVRADDDDPPAPSVIFPSAALTFAAIPPRFRCASTIAIADLAAQMSVPREELVTALVTRGFFSVTVKSVLPRETARTAAAMYGWEVEDQDGLPAAPRPKADPARSAAPKTSKALPKAKAKTGTKAKLANKPTRRGG